MIKPVLSGDALLEDIAQASIEPDEFHMWWLGQSGFLIQWKRNHLLLDPYLSDSLTQKYAQTDKPHVRMTELAIDPRRLDFIDVVTSSHNHTDHLDAATLTPLLEVNTHMEIVVPMANQQFASERLNVPAERLRPLGDGQRVRLDPFYLHAVPAAHETVERDDQERCKFLGYLISFGDWTVYHSGDTVPYGSMVERLSKFSIDVAILPINGRAPERRVAGNLWGREAAELARQISARRVIPCHFEMFEFNTATPDEFAATCESIGQPYDVLRCGERWSSSSL